MIEQLLHTQVVREFQPDGGGSNAIPMRETEIFESNPLLFFEVGEGTVEQVINCIKKSVDCAKKLM